jgi:hypothetical protein
MLVYRPVYLVQSYTESKAVGYLGIDASRVNPMVRKVL